MRQFVYGARFEPGDERGIVVTFPDVPEAITQGDDEADAMTMAEEALGLALLSYAERGLPAPLPAASDPGLVPIVLAAETAAKLALLDAFRSANMSKTELARR